MDGKSWLLLLLATYRTARSTIKEEMRVKVFLPSARYTPTYTGNREETVSRLAVTHFRRHKFSIDNWCMSWSSYLNQNIRNALHNPQQLLYLCRRKVWAELVPVLQEPEDTSFIGEDDRRTIWIEIFATGPPQTRHGRPINIDTYYVPHI